jgi:hypothetical protein
VIYRVGDIIVGKLAEKIRRLIRSTTIHINHTNHPVAPSRAVAFSGYAYSYHLTSFSSVLANAAYSFSGSSLSPAFWPNPFHASPLQSVCTIPLSLNTDSSPSSDSPDTEPPYPYTPIEHNSMSY